MRVSIVYTIAQLATTCIMTDNYRMMHTWRFKLLSRDNYNMWRMQAESLFIKNNTWSYIMGIIPIPENKGDLDTTAKIAAETKYDEWLSTDHKVKADLILCIRPTQLKQIKGCQTSNEYRKSLIL